MSEQISKSWVDCAVTIWDRALSFPSIQEVVLAEEAFKQDSLFNGTQKLQSIISKAHTHENIEWSFQMLHHYHGAGYITTEDCSVRSLTGGRKEDEGAGLIDIITFKKRILSHYMDVVLPNQQMPSEHREAFRETCQSISQYCKRSPTKAHGVLIYYNIIELICNWFGTEFELSSGPPQPPRPPPMDGWKRRRQRELLHSH